MKELKLEIASHSMVLIATQTPDTAAQKTASTNPNMDTKYTKEVVLVTIGFWT